MRKQIGEVLTRGTIIKRRVSGTLDFMALKAARVPIVCQWNIFPVAGP